MCNDGCNCGSSHDGKSCGGSCSSHGKDKGIKISEKHGVNATIPVCFFCGKEKDEIALLGKLPGDAEAPRTALLDYTPCQECEEKFNSGKALIGVSMVPVVSNMPPIREDNGVLLYPTGRWLVLDSSVQLTEDGSEPESGPILIDDCVLSEIFKKQDELREEKDDVE